MPIPSVAEAKKQLKRKQAADQARIQEVAENCIRRCSENLSIGLPYSPQFKVKQESIDIVVETFQAAGFVVEVSKKYYPSNRCYTFYLKFK